MDPRNLSTIKDNNISNSVSDTRKLAIFQNDSDFYVVHKKAEKLAVATYMITNFFVAEEPLKWTMRKAVGEFLKDTISLSSVSLSTKDSLMRVLGSKIAEILSLYEVAFKAGFISEMNFSVIAEEMNMVLEILNKRESSQVNTKSISFNKSFFHVERPAEEERKDVEKKDSWQESSTLNRLSSYPQSSHFNTHDTSAKKSAGAFAPKTPLSFIKDNLILKDIKDKRQNIIINLIKKHRTLTIKGFTAVIKDCSEKTIQRELLSLVSKGVLKKEGERRWSTYSLA